jgi:hypothetical protein
MEKVFNITARLEDRKRKEQVQEYRDRFEAIQRVLQCSGCQYKCAMCNRHIDPSDPSSPPLSTPAEFILCESCQSEFDAFRRASRKDAYEPDVFWHNQEWINLWRCWLELQRAINKFRNSFDFNKIAE